MATESLHSYSRSGFDGCEYNYSIHTSSDYSSQHIPRQLKPSFYLNDIPSFDKPQTCRDEDKYCSPNFSSSNSSKATMFSLMSQIHTPPPGFEDSMVQHFPKRNSHEDLFNPSASRYSVPTFQDVSMDSRSYQKQQQRSRRSSNLNKPLPPTPSRAFTFQTIEQEQNLHNASRSNSQPISPTQTPAGTPAGSASTFTSQPKKRLNHARSFTQILKLNNDMPPSSAVTKRSISGPILSQTSPKHPLTHARSRNPSTCSSVGSISSTSSGSFSSSSSSSSSSSCTFNSTLSPSTTTTQSNRNSIDPYATLPASTLATISLHNPTFSSIPEDQLRLFMGLYLQGLYGDFTSWKVIPVSHWATHFVSGKLDAIAVNAEASWKSNRGMDHKLALKRFHDLVKNYI